MRSPWKRVPWTRAAVAVATAAVSALPLINGCKSDVERADEKVSADLDTAHLAMASSHPEAAREALAKTTDTKGASPTAQIESHLLAAQADLNAANLLINGPAPSSSSAISFRAIVEGKAASQTGTQTLTTDERANLVGIEQRQIRIAQLVSSMAAVGQQLALTNINVAGYKALDPAQARAALQKAASDAEKGDKGVWVAGAAPLASLEGLKAREQELQKQIADLTAQRNDLNSKRGQALQDAGKFSQQSDSTSSTESVGFFTQAANQRKDAADSEVKISQLDAQLAPLQQDLGLVQVQEKAIGEIIASYGAQSQQVEAAWKDVQNRIDQASALSKDLLDKAEPGGGAAKAPAAPDLTGATPAAAAAPTVSVSTTPHSLVGIAAELDAQEKEVQSLRARAVTLLNSAAKHYDQALGIANTLTKSLTALSTGSDAAKLPERRAWQELIALNSPAGFKLRQAEVQGILARLYTDQFAELSQRNRVAAQVTGALKQAGIASPASGGTALIADAPVADDLVKKLQGYEGDLKQEQPPFDKDAPDLSALAAGEISPTAQQAIAATQADVAFHWAASLLDDVIKNPGQGDSGQMLGNIGHAALMATDYAQSQFAMLQGKDQESSAEMKEALSERQALADANAQNLLPSALPAGLAFEVKPIAPATGPGIPAPTGPGTPAPLTVASGPDTGAGPTASAQTVAYPTFGIAFSPPPGVTADSGAGLSPGYIANYQLKPSPAAGVVVVERLASGGSNAQQLAQTIAQQAGASVDPGTFTIGGEDARKLTAAIHEGDYTSRVSYVVVHGTQAYLLSAVGGAQSAAGPATDALVKTVAFTPPDPPAKHLDELFGEPFVVWGFTMNGPSCLRRVEHTESDAHLGIYDFSGKTMTNPLNLDFQHIVAGSPKTFADIRDAYSAALQKQLGLANPLVWHEQPGVAGLNVSDPVKASAKLESGEQVTTTLRYCMLQVAPGDFTQILFNLSDMPDIDLAVFTAAEDRMLSSIKVSPTKPDATAPSATTPAAGTTPPPEGTTPPATAPVPAAGTTPPAQ